MDRCVLFCVTGREEEFFQKGLLVALKSVRGTNPDVPVVVFYDVLSSSQKEALAGCDLRQVDPSPFDFHNRDDLTKATFFRFYVGRKLGQVRKVLYLDCDVVVLDSLDPIFQVNAPLAAALKIPATPEEEYRDPGVFQNGEGIEKWHPIFNGGVLCFDGPFWQREDLLGRALDVAEKYGWDMFPNCDQGILNLIVNTLDGYYQLHPRFNFWPAASPRARLRRNRLRLLAPMIACHPAIVVHWAGPKKPWMVQPRIFHRLFPQLYRVTADACYHQWKNLADAGKRNLKTPVIENSKPE